MRVYLRPVTLDDGPILVKWRNSPSVMPRCMIQKPITVESNKQFYHKNVETGLYKQYMVERIDEDFGVATYPIATVYLKDIDDYNKRCELCVFTSDDQEWNTESQSMAIRMLLDKAFNEFGMHKVYSFSFSLYKDEMDLLINSGFKKEAVLEKEALNMDGEYKDMIRFAAFKKNNNAT